VAGKGLVINVKIEGGRETLRAFRELPKVASDELRDAAGKIADDMVGWVQNLASSTSRQAALVAGTTKRVRDRVPAVSIGGSKRIGTGTGRRKGAAYEILFGANFGSRSHRQFPAWAGVGNDYFVFKSIEAHAHEVEERWLGAADAIGQRWASDTGLTGVSGE
jgi:hypothetical protein